MAGFRYFAAIRTRLLSDSALTAFVGNRVFPMHLASVQEPLFPCVTFWQKQGSLAPSTFHPRMWDRAQLMIQIYTQKDLAELFAIYERITVTLHEKTQAVSNTEVAFHQLSEIWANSGIYDKNTNAWQLSCIYQVRANLRNP